MKLKKNQPDRIKDKYTCCRNCILRPEQKIFSSKNIPNKYEIFLHREVCQGSKNIWEFSQIFGSKKNEGCFEAQVSELDFKEENEYFSFMKNIPWVILGFFREIMMNKRWMGHLGENQGHAQVFKSI